MMQLLRSHGTRATMLVLVFIFYLLALPTTVTGPELAALGQHVRFEIREMAPVDDGGPMRQARAVHPALSHITAWISSVGSGVALADVDDDGLPNDACLVDPRNDTVTILPVPGTPSRYIPFTLQSPTEGYDLDTIAPMGCLLADFNEDGNSDALVYYWGRTPVVFLRNGTIPISRSAFSMVEIVSLRERWFTNAAVLADFDGDGHLDIMFANYFSDGERILDPTAQDQPALQHSMSRAFNSGKKHLLIWNEASGSKNNLSYVDKSDSIPQAARFGWTLALGAQDLDGDLLPDIYVANDFGPDRLLHNRSRPGRLEFAIVEGRRDLTTPRSKVLGQDSFKGMGVDFGDINGDGAYDIAVSNIARPYALIESHFLFINTGDKNAFFDGHAPFVDLSSRYGTWISDWSWDVKLADLDNNGKLELIQAIGFIQGHTNRWPELQEVATGNDEILSWPKVWPKFSPGDDLSGQGHDRVFVMDKGGYYHDISIQIGLTGPSVSRGIAIADIDGDGRLDVAIARQWMPSIVLHNVSQTSNRSLVLDLRLPAGKSSRPAIGARATLTLADGRVVIGTVDGGSGHSGKRAPEIHLGLGDVAADAPLPVKLAWRDAAGMHERPMLLRPGRHRIMLEVEPKNATTESQGRREG